MAHEIERKFLVKDDRWRHGADGGVSIRQAYLCRTPSISLRIRVADESRATLTVKSPEAQIRRLEFEYPIPLADAYALIALREGAIVEKRRHRLPWRGLTFEIDVFQGENQGLVIAEIELPHESACFEKPAWLGAEITADARYSNASLAARPFSSWSTPSRANHFVSLK
ncbi:MAG TPA: CYTH domain-containing protein [Xanthobacteraceae bacterium]|jgi:adenylate cyclase|nr:CYTH domain-containing protein [Xanthobacteraceae bacterium]